MSNSLDGVEIFQSGCWNSITFTDEDLDGIVDSFRALKLSGRVPIKQGHKGADCRDDDTQPALGWVSKIYRRGDKLLADLVDLAPSIVEQIKSKALKFCSVELLRNVKASNMVIPWVIDGLALLGASAPAVGTLKPLSARRLPLDFEESISFTRQENDDDMTTKEEFAALTKKHITMLFESAVREGRVLPRDREMFNRRFPDATAEDAESYIAQTPKPPKSAPASFSTGHTTVTPGSGRADFRLAEEAQRLVIERRNAGDPIPGQSFEQLLAAAKIVLTRDPDLGRAWADMAGEK